MSGILYHLMKLLNELFKEGGYPILPPNHWVQAPIRLSKFQLLADRHLHHMKCGYASEQHVNSALHGARIGLHLVDRNTHGVLLSYGVQ